MVLDCSSVLSRPRTALSALCAALALAAPTTAIAQTSTPSQPGLPASPGASANAFVQPAAATPAAASEWRFRLTPYVWLPTINARIDYPVSGTPGGGAGGGGGLLDGVIDSEIGPNKYLTKLNFAFMLSAEARRGPWVLTGDYIGIRASGLVSSVAGFKPNFGLLPEAPVIASLSAGTETRISTGLVTLMGGYQLVASPVLELDALGGVRVGRLSATMDWTLNAALNLPDGTPALQRTGTASGSKSPVDAVVGVKGIYRINERWTVPYYVDVGAGTSKLTYQVFGGLSYAFDWGNVVLAYRHLYLENDSRDIFKRFTLSGPMLGASFRF